MASTVSCIRRLEWDSMHRVPGHQGKCRAFHGHRYSAEIECVGRVAESGMIVDFGMVKRLVGGWIDENWDHTAILWVNDESTAARTISDFNSSIGYPVFWLDDPPTAENLAQYLGSLSSELLRSEGIDVSAVRLYETPNCSAIWRADPLHVSS